ncbi:hypothetical protein OG596_18720 [Streptomyces sp. NBC_01102]|uniref:hypothetical protein n=1 Tax=unclassified Streptomyces TaxID=2593676 RepID=UPI00386F7562|nr:hypothetical protein OG596_18720 [Streptomyces sp. NBC_01102]
MSSAADSIRRYRVFAGERLAVEVVGEPGVLVSSSAPPPLPGEAPVTHASMSANFRRAENEGALGLLLRNAPGLDAFLAAVRSAGYRVESVDE